MARLLYADPGSRLVYRQAGAALASAAGETGIVYSDTAGTILADIAEYDPDNPSTPGPVIAGSELTVDDYSLLPWFWGPADGQDTLYIQVNSGPVTAINAYYDPRIDSFTSGQVTSVNGQTGAVVLTAADVSAQPLDTDLTVIAGLTPSNDDVLQRKAGAWAARTLAQYAADVQSLLTIAQSQVTNLTTDLANKQPLDTDLTVIAGLAPSDDDVMQRKAGAWAARTLAQYAADIQGILTVAQSQVTNLVTDLANKQPLDTDLTVIAGLTPSNDDVIQRKAGAWTNRTLAQYAADIQSSLTIAQSQVTSLVSDLAAKQPLDTDLTEIAALNPSNDDILQQKAGVWTNRTLAQYASDIQGSLTIAQSQVTNLVSDLALKAPLASPTLTGSVTVSGRITISPDSLTDAATIATDASLGDHFRVTLGGNRTLGNPTNAVDGQMLRWELIQDGTGSRTITLDTKFKLGTDITAVTLSTTANLRDFLQVIYNSGTDKFYVVAFVKGY